MKPRRLILALDPGTKHVGFCLLDPAKRPMSQPLRIGSIDVRGTLHFRLGWIQCEMEQLLSSVTAIACGRGIDVVIEKAIVWGGNIATIALAEVRGVLLGTIARQGFQRLYEYHASSAKKTATGKGNATKSEVVDAIKREFDHAGELSEDAADAGALALHHAHVLTPMSQRDREE